MKRGLVASPASLEVAKAIVCQRGSPQVERFAAVFLKMPDALPHDQITASKVPMPLALGPEFINAFPTESEKDSSGYGLGPLIGKRD
jgi:hypothetical protein